MLLSSIVYPHFLIFRILQLIIPLLYIKLNRTEHFSTAPPSFFSTFTIRINLIPFLYQLHTPLLILPLRMHIQIQRQIHRRMPQQLTDHLIIRALFHTACCKRMTQPVKMNVLRFLLLQKSGIMLSIQPWFHIPPAARHQKMFRCFPAKRLHQIIQRIRNRNLPNGFSGFWRCQQNLRSPLFPAPLPASLFILLLIPFRLCAFISIPSILDIPPVLRISQINSLDGL